MTSAANAWVFQAIVDEALEVRLPGVSDGSGKGMGRGWDGGHPDCQRPEEYIALNGPTD